MEETNKFNRNFMEQNELKKLMRVGKNKLLNQKHG